MTADDIDVLLSGATDWIDSRGDLMARWCNALTPMTLLASDFLDVFHAIRVIKHKYKF